MDRTQQDEVCYGEGSVAGAVIGTFCATIFLLAIAAFLYKQWRRHKGKHLVLVTDPEIVEDAYAFDNPCFKDTTPAVGRSLERPVSQMSSTSPSKDSIKWSGPWTTPWSTLGLATGNRKDKRRTLDDTYVGPKATRISVVSLRSRDFTGLGFNVCGNMREGIFVKDVLHRGPASESGRIHSGDRINTVRISFRNMVYEDALTILSYASPYDVEIEVESGGNASKPTTLLKKSVGPNPAKMCHPLYRSQSIPELHKNHKSLAKRLFIADPNDSLGSNHSTINNTLVHNSTTKSPRTNASQSLEKRPEEVKNNNHQKFGIKVLPALDGTVHRIENQNEHNTNLERRNSKNVDVERGVSKQNSNMVLAENNKPEEDSKLVVEKVQQQENTEKPAKLSNSDSIPLSSVDSVDRAKDNMGIPSEVPTEVHNAAVAARRNRKNSPELVSTENGKSAEVKDVFKESTDEGKSPQKNKRKAPAPPKINVDSEKKQSGDKIDIIADYKESKSIAKQEKDAEVNRKLRLEKHALHRRNSESDTDSEIQNSFTKIELNSADITIHHTPVPEVDDAEDDMYRKAASLGDLSKYENKTTATLERAQSLDMTDANLKKRKAPMPPEDINESTEDLTKLDDMDSFDKRKLKKSNEWGTLEDAIWHNPESEERNNQNRKKSNGTLEQDKPAVEIKLENGIEDNDEEHVTVSDNAIDDSEVIDLPIKKKDIEDFIDREREFISSEDNDISKFVINKPVAKSSIEDEQLDFKQSTSVLHGSREAESPIKSDKLEDEDAEKELNFRKALRQFDSSVSKTPLTNEIKVNLSPAWVEDGTNYNEREPVIEEPLTKVTIEYGCPACERKFGKHHEHCSRALEDKPRKSTQEFNEAALDSTSVVVENVSFPQTHYQKNNPKYESALTMIRVQDPSETDKQSTESMSTFQTNRTKFEQAAEANNPVKTSVSYSSKRSPTDTKTHDSHYAKKVVHLPTSSSDETVLADCDSSHEYNSGVTVNSKNFSTGNRQNISSVNVSSGEKSEDSGSLCEDRDSETKISLPNILMPVSPQKMTYITEIKVSTSREKPQNLSTDESANVVEDNNDPQKSTQDVTITSNGKITPAKKPPVPPRKTEARSIKTEGSDRQVVYVSEYKSSPKDKESTETTDDKHPSAGRKFEHWVYLNDNKDQNLWGNGSSSLQPITNIVLSSGDDKVIRK